MLNTEDLSEKKALITRANDNDFLQTKVSEPIQILTYRKALEKMLKFSAPFFLSRLAIAINGIGNGIVLSKMGHNATAAGPLVSTFQNVIMGTVRGGAASTGIMVGNLNGLGKKTKIGRIMLQGLILGAIFTIPAVAILSNTKNILIATGVDNGIAEETQRYFSVALYGVTPTFWVVSDQQLALGIKRSNITLGMASAYAGIAMLIGYPLAFGIFGLPALGIVGIGYGFTISSWITFLGLRSYYAWDPSFREFNLFTVDKNVFKGISKHAKLFLPLAIQTLLEWGNLFSISMLSGRLGDRVLIAQQPSVQITTTFNLMMLSLSQATSVAVANEVGVAQKELKNGNHDTAEICRKNYHTLGNSGTTIGLMLSSIVSGLCFLIPSQLISLFINKNDTDHQTSRLAQAFIFIAAVGMFIDTIRNGFSGSLAGLKDTLFAAILSFFTLYVIGLTSGGLVSDVFNQGSEWLYVTRDIALLIAAIGITTRWLTQSSNLEPIQEKKLVVASEPKSTCCNWNPFRHFKIYNERKDSDYDKSNHVININNHKQMS